MSKGKKGKNLIKCPLFIMTSVSVIGFMLYGAIVTYFGNYEFELSWDQPAFASLILDKKLEADMIPEEALEEETEEEDIEILAEQIMTEETETESEEVAEEEEPAPEAPEEYVSNEIIHQDGTISVVADSNTVFVERAGSEPRSGCYNNPGVMPLSTEYDYQQVGIDYFANSLFVGDSRMEGLAYYGAIDSATFLYKTGMSIYRIMDTPLKSKVGTEYGEDVLLPDVLQSRSYDNIYLMLGINELGNNTSSFSKKYSEVIGQIRQYQPDARIIIMGIMYVTTDYESNPATFNNDNVNSKNVAISRYANGHTIFYLDMNPVVVDETGGLNPEYTFDGCHLKAQYYQLWTDFMCAHAY